MDVGENVKRHCVHRDRSRNSDDLSLLPAQEIVTGVLTLLACLALHRVMALQREVGELQKKVGKLELADWVTDWGNRTAC